LGVNASASAPINYYVIKNKITWVKNIGAGYASESGEYKFYGKVPVATGKYDYFILEREKDLTVVEGFQKIKIIREYPATNLILTKAE